MGILGVINKIRKGSKKNKELNKAINRLEEIDNSTVIELVDSELSYKLYLKKIEYFIAKENGEPIYKLDNIEKQIIKLMTTNIEDNRDVLKNKPASQFEIANLVLSIQKLRNETALNFHSLAKKSVHWLDKSEKDFKEMNTSFNSLESQVTDEVENTKNRLEESSLALKQEIGELNNSQQSLSKSNEELANIVLELDENIEKNKISLQEKISTTSSNLVVKIDETKEIFSNLVDNLKVDTNKQFENVNTSILQSIKDSKLIKTELLEFKEKTIKNSEKLKNEINILIDNHSKTLGQKIANVSNETQKLSNQISNIQSDFVEYKKSTDKEIQASRLEINKTISELDNRLKNQFNELQNKSELLNQSLNRIIRIGKISLVALFSAILISLVMNFIK